MRIEHIGINIKAPAEMAEWYCKNLGLQIVRDTGQAFFLADENKNSILEIYNNPPDAVPDYASMDPLLFHIAFASDDVKADFDRLKEAGAKPFGEIVEAAGDTIAILRDPWGLPIQLAKRKTPMLDT